MNIIPAFDGNKKKQNEAHLKNLILMALSDHNIDKSEVEVIYQIGLDRGILPERIKELLISKERSSLIVPANDYDRFEQLYDLTIVMLADGIVEDEEMEFCTDFASKLGFRKTISWLLILSILDGVEKGLSRKEVFSICRSYLKGN